MLALPIPIPNRQLPERTSRRIRRIRWYCNEDARLRNYAIPTSHLRRDTIQYVNVQLDASIRGCYAREQPCRLLTVLDLLGCDSSLDVSCCYCMGCVAETGD